MHAQCRGNLAIGEPAGRSEQYLAGWRFGEWWLQQGGDVSGRPSDMWSDEKAGGFLARLAAANGQGDVASKSAAPVHPSDVDIDGPTVEIQSNALGDTLWVNAADGSCIARFSKRFGIDVHSSAESLMAGASHCLYCTHGAAGPAEWHTFRQKVQEHHGVDVPEGAVTFA